MRVACIRGHIGARVAQRLAREHGSPDLGNKPDPLDELIYIALTRQTHAKNAGRTWSALTTKYRSWENVLAAPETELASTIADGGFSRQKARWIQQSLRLIKERFGTLSLRSLEGVDDLEAERFLCSLPGINIKSAKCILMYSLGRQVLPVDTHVRRLSERLGLVEAGLSSRRLHEELELAVPPRWRYDFHVNAVVHGRKVCTALAPKCQGCVLRDMCDYFHNVIASH